MGNIVTKVHLSLIGREVKSKVQQPQLEFNSMEVETVKIKEEKEFDDEDSLDVDLNASTVANDEDREEDFDSSTDVDDEDNQEVGFDDRDKMSAASSWDSGLQETESVYSHASMSSILSSRRGGSHDLAAYVRRLRPMPLGRKIELAMCRAREIIREAIAAGAMR